MQKIIPKSKDIFIGEPGAVMSGSLILEAWTKQGGYWVYEIPSEFASTGLANPKACHCEKEYPIQVDSIFCQKNKTIKIYPNPHKIVERIMIER